MALSLPFNNVAFPWRKKKLERLIAADDAARLDAFLKWHPKAVDWEEVRGPNHHTYIHRATQDRKYKAAEVLVDHGARLDTPASSGGTLILHAVRIGYSGLPPMNAEDAAFVEKLLAKGADIDQRDRRGFSPLKTAVSIPNVKLVEFLLAHGADPETPDEDRTTLLMETVSNRHNKLKIAVREQLVSLLLDAGADVHRWNHDGRTALFFVTDMSVAKMLLERGANPEHVDKQGRHIWEIDSNKNSPVAEFLRQTAEQRQQARAAQASEREVDAACHDGVRPVAIKPLKLKS